ncbi:MAG: peptidylprolyl isomerase, partial [Myxococcales bacterium]|nr:peptidylprolyl isomerase [Myxococcales bacterium]
GEQAAAPTAEGEQAAAPTAEGEQAAAPTAEGEQAAAPTAEGEQAAAPTAEGEQAAAPTAEGEQAAAPTAEGEQAAAPTAEGEQAAAPEPVAPPAPPEDIFAKVASTESDRDAATGGLIAEPKTKEELNVWPYGPEVADAVFKLESGQRTEVIEVSGGFWILRVEEKLPAFEKSLEDSKLEIARKLLQQERAVAKAQEFAKEILEAAKADTSKSLTDIVTEWNARHPVTGKEAGVLSANETAPFARMSAGSIPRPADMEGFVPGLGKAPEIIDIAFKLSTENPLSPQVHKLPDTDRVLVIRFKEKIDPTEEETKTQRNLIKRELSAMTKVQTYLAWYRALLGDAQKNGDVELTGAYHDLVTQEKQLIESRNAPKKQPAAPDTAAAPAP